MIPSAELKKFFDAFDDSCAPVVYDDEGEQVPGATTLFAWSAKGIGFGEFRIYFDDHGQLRCSNEGNEGMGKEFIKRMLCKMVDDAELDDGPASTSNE